MLKWLKSLFGPRPTGPPQTLRAFDPSEPTFSESAVRVEEDAFVIESSETTRVTLFELYDPDAEQCLLTYRANAKAEDFQGRAFLEMALKLPKVPEHSAQGVETAVSGSTDWQMMEAPVYLYPGQKPEKLTLKLVLEGQGKIRMKDVEVLRTPVE